MYAVIAILLSILSLSFSQSCQYTAPDGTVYNLSGARNSAADYTFDDVEAQFTYFINFCGPTIVPCNNSAACLEPFFSIDSYASLGLYSTQDILDLPDDGWAGLTLHFANGSECPESPGDSRNITVNIRCAYGQPTTFVSAVQDIDCSFTAYFTSGAACPSQCPQGKRGGTCQTCLEGYYGANCAPCQCQFGACSPTDGSCKCQKGWAGTNCDMCSPSRCTFNSSNAFLFNLTTLAQEETDYHFIGEGQEYYVNLLADTNTACGGLNTPVCQHTSGSYLSLGDLNTESIQALDGSGVMISYTGGSYCSANRNLSVTLTVFCQQGAPTQVVAVSQDDSCSYSIAINSGAVCPQCTPGRYGGSCTSCTCTNSVSCNDGFNGNGTCNCETGFVGDQCDNCASGRFGSSCEACACDADHSLCLDGIEGSGSCICFAGYGGDDCSTKQSEVDNSENWTYAGVAAAIGIVVGAGIAVGICGIVISRRRQYESIRDH